MSFIWVKSLEEHWFFWRHIWLLQVMLIISMGKLLKADLFWFERWLQFGFFRAKIVPKPPKPRWVLRTPRVTVQRSQSVSWLHKKALEQTNLNLGVTAGLPLYYFILWRLNWREQKLDNFSKDSGKPQRLTVLKTWEVKGNLPMSFLPIKKDMQ